MFTARHVPFRALLTLFIVFAAHIVVASAQTRGVVSEAAPIYIKPDDRLEPLRTAAAGTMLLVRDTQEAWLQVEFQDPQFGRRIGWIRRDRVQLEAPNRRPMDLSVAPVTPTAPAVDVPAASAPGFGEDGHDAAPARRPARPARDVTDAAPFRERGWLDVNLGAAWSGDDDNAFAWLSILYGEPLALAAYYPKPPVGASFDIGGGAMVSRMVGVGASLVGTAHEEIVGLGATVPHPYFFNASVVASGSTDEKLLRTEGSLNLHAMVIPYQSRRLRVRAFGGPSYFRYEADMVHDVGFRQAALPFSRSQAVTIDGYEAVKAEGTGWGWHAGGDVSVFFTRVFGLGGFARYSRGTVEIDEPLSESAQDVRVGGFQAGGGIRLRF